MSDTAPSSKQLSKFIKNRSLVCIWRENLAANSLQAFPISFSPSLLLVQYVADFRLDGQLFLRRKDITSISCRKTDQFHQKLLDQDGIIENVDFDFEANIDSFSDLLNSLPKETIVILENENVNEQQLYLGRIVHSDVQTITIHEFTGAANWHDKLTHINHDDITCCQLNTNYIYYYTQYFETYRPPPIPEK